MLLCAISGASDFFHPPCRVHGQPPEPACPLLPDELASAQDPVHSPSTPERFHGRSEPFMLYRSFLPWSSSGRLAWRIIGPPQITADPRWYCGSSSVGEQGALGGLFHYLIVFSMKPSVLAFSINVRTFARSRPDGTSASISSFRVTSLPGMVVSCSTTASTI